MLKIISTIFNWNLFYIYPYFFEMTTKKPLLSKVRLYVTVPVQKIESKVPACTVTNHENKITKKIAIKTLENLLGIKTISALEIISRNKILQKVSSAKMKSNYLIYIQKSITNKTLLKYPELLAAENVEVKLLEIQKLPYDVNTVAALLLLPPKILSNFVQIEINMNKRPGKIANLSTLLEVNEEKVCELITKKVFLCSLPIEKIKSNIKLLTDFGISLKEIQNDLWILKYNNKTIKTRLNDAKKHNIDDLKTWMVRAKPEIFQTYIQRRSDNKLILGDNSLTEYLSERLQCSTDMTNYLILKQPALKNKSLKKLKELIDFLFTAGFQPHHICRIPKILVHSVDTIRKRLKQLEEIGIQIDSLYILTKSQKQFTQYYEILLKNKNVMK